MKKLALLLVPLSLAAQPFVDLQTQVKRNLQPTHGGFGTLPGNPSMAFCGDGTWSATKCTNTAAGGTVLTPLSLNSVVIGGGIGAPFIVSNVTVDAAEAPGTGILRALSFITETASHSAFAMKSAGSNYGQVANINPTTWGLGFGSASTTYGTSALTWNDSGLVSVPGTFKVATLNGVGIYAGGLLGVATGLSTNCVLVDGTSAPCAGGGSVLSVFGRAPVVIAQIGDYNAAQVTNAVDQTGSYSNPTWLVSLSASKLLLGTIPAARLPFPTLTTAGGVQAKFCPAGSHVVNINADSTVDCSADSGGGGGGTGTFVDWQKPTSQITNLNVGDVAIYSKTVPALAAGECFTVSTSWALTNFAAGINSYKLWYGSQSFTLVNANAQTNVWMLPVAKICNDPGVQNAQTILTPGFARSDGSDFGQTPGAIAQDATIPQVIKLTANAAGASDGVTGYGWTITMDTASGGGGGGGGSGTPGGTAGQIQTKVDATTFGGITVSGDATLNGVSGALALSSVVSPGSCGSTTTSCGLTVDGKGRITALSNNTIAGGGGGGASSVPQLTDLQAVRTNSTVITVGSGACTVGPTSSILSSVTLTISAGTAMARVSCDRSVFPPVIRVHKDTLTVACSGSCVTDTNAVFGVDDSPLFAWTATSGTWDTSGGTDYRAIAGGYRALPGFGLLKSLSGGTETWALDPTILATQYSAATFGVCVGSPCTVASTITPPFIVTSTRTLSKCYIAANTAPTGASLIVDVKKNGTSVFGGNPKLTLTAGSTGVLSVTAFATTAFAENDKITVDITQIGSLIAGQDVEAVCVF